MKNSPLHLRQIFVALLLILISGGCSEDFDMEAPYKPVTVVYGILNKEEAINYIRIQKVFQSGSGSAYTGALIADSNFDSRIEVVVKEFNKKRQLVSETKLPRVDLNREGLAKKPGPFFNDYNYAYKYARQLDTQNRYRLVISNKETGITDSAETGIISPVEFVPMDCRESSSLPGGLSIGDPAQKQTSGFLQPYNTGICWGIMDIHYQEINTRTGDTTLKTASFYMPYTTDYVLVARPSFCWQNPNTAFYGFLATNIKESRPGIKLRLVNCDLTVCAGAKELAQYIYLSASLQSGIAGTSMGTVKYTNIMSTGGLAIGIFSSAVSKSYPHMAISYSADTLQKYVPGQYYIR